MWKKPNVGSQILALAPQNMAPIIGKCYNALFCHLLGASWEQAQQKWGPSIYINNHEESILLNSNQEESILSSIFFQIYFLNLLFHLLTSISPLWGWIMWQSVLSTLQMEGQISFFLYVLHPLYLENVKEKRCPTFYFKRLMGHFITIHAHKGEIEGKWGNRGCVGFGFPLCLKKLRMDWRCPWNVPNGIIKIKS